MQDSNTLKSFLNPRQERAWFVKMDYSGDNWWCLRQTNWIQSFGLKIIFRFVIVTVISMLDFCFSNTRSQVLWTAKNFDQLQISDDEFIGHIIGPHINRVIHWKYISGITSRQDRENEKKIMSENGASCFYRWLNFPVTGRDPRVSEEAWVQISRHWRNLETFRY